MVELQGVSKYYYSKDSATLGLKSINLEFKKGEFIAITGESGSGKTTLINVISGMDSYEDGEMFVNGKKTSYYDYEDWENYRREHISLIYQSYNLIDSYTALENIESVLLICESADNKMTKRERKKKAMHYLEEVGLKKQARQKAAHLSSGQKQRLGIARALAKDTDIIIADEPTGNLDVENGRQVIELLSKLSKDRLVIMVTHNYDQAEPYVTRKVRMYDGEVVEDIAVNTPEDKIEIPTVEEAEFKSRGLYGSWKLVRMNIKSQPKRTSFMTSFILVSILGAVLIFGMFLSTLDINIMKATDNGAFLNQDKTRLIVRSETGDTLNSSDIDNIAGISHINYVDLYDGANEINYYYKKDTDYKINYQTNYSGDKTSISIEVKDNTQFMKSESGLKESDLSAGRLPEKYNEVVLYSDDDSVLNSVIQFYFLNNQMWNISNVAEVDMTVVGILKKNENQVYFEEEFSKLMGSRIDEEEITFDYNKIDTTVYTDTSKEDYVFVSSRNFVGIVVPNGDLAEGMVKISNNFFSSINTNEELSDKSGVKTSVIGDTGTITKKGTSNKINATILEKGSNSTNNVLEVSYDIYQKIYSDNNTYQMSVYIDDYCNTDKVIEDIKDKGYEVISAFRMSTTEFDPDLVLEQCIKMGISAGLLLILFGLDVIVIYLLMKLKKSDFIIFKSLGMEQKMVGQMNYLELIFLTALSEIVVIIFANVIGRLWVPEVWNLIKYYSVSSYAVICIYGIGIAVVTAHFYNKFLFKRIKITSLKED